MNDTQKRDLNCDKKPKIKEVIVVEGRDDTLAVSKAVNAITVETHGFGLSSKMWEILDKAYRERGLIILTDPDHGGRSIRRKIINRFPKSKEAFISKEKASKKGDVGIENAAPDDILEALKKARASLIESSDESTKERYDMSWLIKLKLVGESNSRKRREVFCDSLGIGYSNAKGLLKKLNQYEINEDEIKSALRSVYRKDIVEEK